MNYLHTSFKDTTNRTLQMNILGEEIHSALLQAVASCNMDSLAWTTYEDTNKVTIYQDLVVVQTQKSVSCLFVGGVVWGSVF